MADRALPDRLPVRLQMQRPEALWGAETWGS